MIANLSKLSHDIFMKLINRSLAPHILKAAQQLPVVTITGPRQSGKTTLVRSLFPDRPYINLEGLDDRRLAQRDPRGFLEQYPDGVILDEIQHLPELFSYIQLFVDERQKPGQIILTGSQNFLLMEKVTQTLAGRVAIFQLLPFSSREVKPSLPISAQMLKGFYPRLYSQAIDPKLFYDNYITTYIERDVRQLKNIMNLSQFRIFMEMCAYRVGQLLNLSSLALDCGISVNTAKHWLSLLETSYIICLIRPYHKNYGKRLVKMPKLYFYDVGIAAHLADVRADTIDRHPLKGNLFENMVMMDIYKSLLPDRPRLYFWRDKVGNEVDGLVETTQGLVAIEVKSSQTLQPDYTRGLFHFHKLAPDARSYVIYGGREEKRSEEVNYIPWSKMDKFAF